MRQVKFKEGESVQEQLDSLKSEGYTEMEILSAIGYLYSQGKASWKHFVFIARKMGMSITTQDEAILRQKYGIPEDGILNPNRPGCANFHKPKEK